MTGGPALPPKARGPMARRLTAAAAQGRFDLPVCEDCGVPQYPLRERCVGCYSDRLTWRPVAPTGTLLARTVGHHSTDPYFQARRPLQIGSVKLDAGPVAIVFVAAGCGDAGARVRLANRLDRAGEAVLIAIPADSVHSEANVMSDPNCEITGKVVLITGAPGGIGRALTAAFREAGAAEVIAICGPSASAGPTTLDVTDRVAVEALAASLGGRVDILINNAGFNGNSAMLAATDESHARREMEVNYFGLLNMVRAFSPAMRARGQGVIVNMLSVLSHVSLPAIGSYCASKAAALSLTQAVRAELAPWGVRVCSILPGAVDTRMSAQSPPPKLAPAQLANAIVRALREGLEDVYPGAMAEGMHAALRLDAKALEKEMASRLPTQKL
jgi:NAD(P)-dependent dehydrogenase (short-subunit alcohol dehydrogenase family)/uncharacterized OB-fold protein